MKFISIITCLLLFFLGSQAKEMTWEESTASWFSDDFRSNSERLHAITEELQDITIPYQGGPTATGGYLSHWFPSPDRKAKLNFRWSNKQEINAIALLPLRLYLSDKGNFTNNAYWPGDIVISALIDGKMVKVAQIKDSQKMIKRSLPEWVELENINTKHIQITCTNLTKEAYSPLYAAGFSEIFIFSGNANIASYSKVSATAGKEDKAIFSKHYLTNGQTPLGLPEKGTERPKGLGIFYTSKSPTLAKPYVFEMTYEEDTLVDAVRLDPAIIHTPGQAFPVRFTIDLLDQDRKVIASSKIHESDYFPNPGLNPYIAYFDETTVRGIRLTILEASMPIGGRNSIIQLSEITPIFQGNVIHKPVTFKNSTKTPEQISNIFEDDAEQLYWSLPSVNDGMTHAGKVLSHYEWIKGLATRRQLLEEQRRLKLLQLQITETTRSWTLWVLSLLTLAIISLALYIIFRTRSKARQNIQKLRERIACDLHDETGSSLGAIVLHAGQLQSKSKNPDELKSINAILRLSRESVLGIREVLHATTPRIGRAQNLSTYMRELADLILIDKEYTFDCSEFNYDEKNYDVQLRKDIILFYKEALSNSQKNSQCHKVDITLSNKNRQFIIKIEDDGVGMTSQQLARPRALRTLKQRAERLNGKLNIETKPGEGLRLTLTMKSQ